MARYSKNTGYKLFVGAAAVAASPTGLPVPGSDTFNRVFNLSNVKRGALTQPAGEFYTLDSPIPESIGGNPAPVDWTGRILHDEALTPHVTLESDVLVATGNYRNFRVDYPNGKRYDFVGFMTQWDEEEAEGSGDATAPKAVSITIRQTGSATKSTIP